MLRKIIVVSAILLMPFTVLNAQSPISKSVVKIYTVSDSFNYDNPWQMRGQSKGTGSGCIIEGNRILTNAHVISNSTFIQVKRAGEAKRYTAKVDSVSHHSDLAILTVNDPVFFKNVTPVQIGDLPEVRDKVAVYGFPTGGDEMSITEGVVSRIEQRNYAHSNANLLTCQIDAAINPGNSGGPVIKNDRIVGVAFQSSMRGENIGYMVPAPIINHFLKDISDGKYDGFPELGILFQDMENPDMREKYRMSSEQSGVLIVNMLIDSPAKGILRIDDVVMAIERVKIENDGSIEFRPGERTSLNYLVQKKYINDWINVRILRDGKIRDVKIKLTVPMNSTRLVSFEKYDTRPTYYITGGLVFEPLTKNYILEWGSQWFFSAPSKLLHFYQNGIRTPEKKEIVLLTKVLADEINLGYHDMDNAVIEKVNGKKISHMTDLVRAVEENQNPFHVFEDDSGNKIVLKREKVEKYSNRILETYKIRSDRSEDLRSINRQK
ncbi:MAG TPA: serine protease [Spirochaetota bacterium]|nr:serine protease [Spirochaetota bacterium]HPJ33209.1 serine protease [Spirochaetota bacterium]